MAKLARKLGTVKTQAACLTGWGTAFQTYDGHEVGIIAPNMTALRRAWSSLSFLALDETKVRRVAYFPHEKLTTLKPRRRKPVGKDGDSK